MKNTFFKSEQKKNHQILYYVEFILGELTHQKSI